MKPGYLACAALLVALNAGAQDEAPAQPEGASQSGEGLPTGIPAMGKADVERAQAQIRKMQQAQDKANQERMERLKEANPEAYEQMKEAQARQQKITKIILKLQQKAIGESEAEEELTPLVKKELRYEIDGLDDRIARLEKKLAALKQAKRDPDSLVRRRVELLMGKRPPDDDRE